jgi:hypothetical protein
MRDTVRTIQPLLAALVATGTGVVAFAALSAGGFASETCLLAAMILAGLLNIGAFASLNGDNFLLTSPVPAGELP